MPFKYLLMLPDGQPPDPACFVTAVPNWSVGETFVVAGLRQFRILSINDEIDVDGLEELHERGINGIWMVEPASYDAPTRRRGRRRAPFGAIGRTAYGR